MKKQGNVAKAIEKENVVPFDIEKGKSKQKEEIARRLIDRARERGYQLQRNGFQADPSSFIREHLFNDLAFAKAVFGKEMVCCDCGGSQWGEGAYMGHYCGICLNYKDTVPSYQFHLHRILDASFFDKEFDYLKKFIENNRFFWMDEEDENEGL